MVTKHRVAVNKDLMLYKVESYKTLLTTYLRDDPTPITLSIKQNLAKKMQTMSPAGVGNYIRALKSPFGFLRAEGLWPQDPAGPIKRPKGGKKEREIPTEEEESKEAWDLVQKQYPAEEEGIKSGETDVGGDTKGRGQ